MRALTEPVLISNGLALYRIGEGEPILLMPGPHRFQIPGDGSAQLLIDGLLSLGRQVISFDPPQSGNSTRRAHLSMEEMHQCADETLDALEIATPVDAIGHSMGGLTVLAYTLERPSSIRRLILVGTGSGRRAYMDMSGALANPRHPRFWGMGLRALLHLALPCRASETLMNNYIERCSFVDQQYVVRQPVRSGDWLRPRTGRADWHRIASKLDYAPRLSEITSPTLILCGRHDSQFPLAAAEELAQGIPKASLIVFERSNHFPFIEERVEFWQVVAKFMKEFPGD